MGGRRTKNLARKMPTEPLSACGTALWIAPGSIVTVVTTSATGSVSSKSNKCGCSYLSTALSTVVASVGVVGTSAVRSALDAPTAPGALSGRLATPITVGGTVGAGPATVVVAITCGVCCASVTASALSASSLIVSGADLTHGEH